MEIILKQLKKLRVKVSLKNYENKKLIFQEFQNNQKKMANG